MNVTILGPLSSGGTRLPIYSLQELAGLPSPTGRPETQASLAELCNVNEPHVYLSRIQDDSMQDAGIFSGDLVVVDRSLYAEHGDIVVAALNCEPVCKRLHMRDNVFSLHSDNLKYPPRQVTEEDDLVIWGVVKHSIHTFE
jgi:DNA polymerase V